MSFVFISSNSTTLSLLLFSYVNANHPSTINSIGNLANVLYRQGKYEEAEKVQRQTLELKGKVFGVDHTDTLASINYLALVFRHQGKYKEAEKMDTRDTSQGLRIILERAG